MYDSYIVRRTQIYLDPEQSERVGELALAEGRTRSDVIREAVDRYLAVTDSEPSRLARLKRVIAEMAERGVSPIDEEALAAFRDADRRYEERIRKAWEHDAP
jgi:predicted transcriptional regulator